MTLQQQAVENCGFNPVKTESGTTMYHKNEQGYSVYVNQETHDDSLVLCGFGLRVKLLPDGMVTAWITEGNMRQDIIDTAPMVMQIAAEYNRLALENTDKDGG